MSHKYNKDQGINLEKKIVLVTGSNQGIGKAIADKFASNGCSVIRNGISERNDVDNELYIQADVGTRVGVSTIRQFVEQRFGRLDVLVNNAAFTRFIEDEELDQLTDDLFDRIYSVNLKGPFMCVQALHPLLLMSEDASVINISSVAASTGNGSNIAYCAMKAGLSTMTKSLARSLATIRVNSISPGLIKTNLVTFPGNYIEDMVSKTPLDRVGMPEDIANAAWSLVYSLRYVTGEDIRVDGGRSLN